MSQGSDDCIILALRVMYNSIRSLVRYPLGWPACTKKYKHVKKCKACLQHWNILTTYTAHSRSKCGSSGQMAVLSSLGCNFAVTGSVCLVETPGKLRISYHHGSKYRVSVDLSKVGHWTDYIYTAWRHLKWSVMMEVEKDIDVSK